MVKPGYKQTDVGAIPEDWELVDAASIGTFRGGSGFPLVYQGKKLGEFPFFKVSDMNIPGNRTYMETANNYIDEPVRQRIGATVFPANTIVFAKVGAAIFQERKRILSRPSCIDNNMAGFVVDDPNLDCRYVYWFLLHTRLGDLVNTTALPALNGTVLAEIKVPLPPTKAEQQAIATALSDVDALIEALEQLIAKKRRIKQGALQELLTGKRRLPGFEGEWVVRPLGEVADIRSGGTPSTTQPSFWNGDIPWCTPTDITALKGRKYLFTTARSISDLGLRNSSAELIPQRSVVMTSRATIGECAINQVPVATNQGFKSFVPFDRVDVEYLYYRLLTQKTGFIQLCGGSTFLEIGKNQLAQYELEIPVDRAEQEAIATVLSDMDAEIEALEAKLTKTRQIKQGMMHELLTGRIRLV